MRAAAGAGVDGDVLADHAALADDEAARFALVLEVLRLVTDRGEGEDPGPGADLGPAGYDDVGDQFHVVVQRSTSSPTTE
jgi:hypothetical protein